MYQLIRQPQPITDRLFDAILKGELSPGERLVDRADIMIYDSTYTDDEYPAHKNWGHSTWQEGVRLANAAQVKTLVLFHHDPDHDDDFMDRVAAEAARARPGTAVAREGMELIL